ncbi:MAG TPA: hypothetical protein VF794_33140 [Archangium sp.]|jgi:hypothetical protein|uniref:hypothetical protein n=1 Tax=Archangium sp. TaxID=1872627 RepID=UPI002ED7F94D
MSFKKSWGLGGIAAAMALALPAFAAEREVTIYDDDDTRGGLTRDLGVSVSGGVNAFTGDLGDNTSAGALLGIQANSRPLPLIGLEVGYEGSRNPFENFDGALWRHNVGALAKVGPQLGQNGDLRPFVGAGLGLSVLNPSDDGEVLFNNDFIAEVPVAAGVDYQFGAITAGARATYRFLSGENLGLAQDGNAVNLGINLGGSF